jgi:hypothetical protein
MLGVEAFAGFSHNLQFLSIESGYAQLVEKLPAPYDTIRFIITLTRLR